MFYLVLYLQSAAIGFTPLQAGFLTIPVSLLLLLLAARFGRMADVRGPRGLMTAGATLMAVGVLVWMAMDDQSIAFSFIPGITIFGIGLSMVVAPLTATALRGAPDRYSGVAAAVNTTAARLGTTLMIALVGVVIAVGFSARSSDLPTDQAFSPAASSDQEDEIVWAFRASMVACALFALAGAAVSWRGVSAQSQD